MQEEIESSYYEEEDGESNYESSYRSSINQRVETNTNFAVGSSEEINYGMFKKPNARVSKGGTRTEMSN